MLSDWKNIEIADVFFQQFQKFLFTPQKKNQSDN